MATLDTIDFEAFKLGPGDHLIVHLPDIVPLEMARDFKNALKAELGDVSLVVIVGAEVFVVRNEER